MPFAIPQRGGKIDLLVSLHSDCVFLQVRDNGPGIAVEERARVFDPFYRILGSEQIGSGLGLSIVRTIAERMGASVKLEWADPSTRQGLTVSVSIPLSRTGGES